MTTRQFNQSVQAAIDAKLASAASEARKINTDAIQALLDSAVAAQASCWDALAALERGLGFEVNTDDYELSSWTVDSLIARNNFLTRR